MRRLLILDDDEDAVESLAELISRTSTFVVKTSSSVTEALELYKFEKIDVVLIDIIMPPLKDCDIKLMDNGRKSGIHVIKMMKQINDNIPIIPYTGLSDEEINQELFAIGCTRILLKPLDLDSLTYTLQQSIKVENKD